MAFPGGGCERCLQRIPAHLSRSGVLLLVLTLPPLFTLLFGHAFETGELTGVPSLLIDQDNTPPAQEFIDIISKNKTFQWRHGLPDMKDESNLLGHGVRAALVIPAGWNESLEK